MSSKVLFCTTEQLILDTISLTLNKAKINGFNSTIKESDKLILKISRPIVLEVKTLGDNLKVHIW